MTEKPTEQIIREWQGIESRRPGGALPNVTNLLQVAAERNLPEQERRLIEVITILHDTVQGYHEEMGVLIRDLHAARGEAAATLTAQLRHAATSVLNRYDDGDLTVSPHANRFGRDRVRLAMGDLRRVTTADNPFPPHLN